MTRSGKAAAGKSGVASKSRHLTATDWVDAALVTMAKNGVANVRVERLARDLKVTRGSFYWHFKDRAHLLDAMLLRFQEISVAGGQMAAGADDTRSGVQRIRDLLEAPVKDTDSADGVRMELAIRLWARRSSHVHAMLLDLDKARLQLLAKLISAINGKTRDLHPKTQLLQALNFYLWTRDDLTAADREDLILLMLKVLRQK